MDCTIYFTCVSYMRSLLKMLLNNASIINNVCVNAGLCQSNTFGILSWVTTDHGHGTFKCKVNRAIYLFSFFLKWLDIFSNGKAKKEKTLNTIIQNDNRHSWICTGPLSSLQSEMNDIYHQNRVFSLISLGKESRRSSVCNFIKSGSRMCRKTEENEILKNNVSLCVFIFKETAKVSMKHISVSPCKDYCY